MKKSYLIIVFCLVLVGCKKEYPPEFDLQSLYPELIGEWTWERTIYINGPFPEIPETTESSLDYFLRINANGTIEYFQDGFLIHVRFIKNFNSELEFIENGSLTTRLSFDLYPYLDNDTYNDGDLLILRHYVNTNEIGILGLPFTHYDHPVYGEIPTRNLYRRK